MPTSPPVFMKRERKAWGNNRDNAKKRRYTGRALQRERETLFALEPLCRQCAAEGRTSIATIRDHILALAFGGADTRENVQPLCQTCSDAKTQGESRTGRTAI
jgi:5-methylcytosine-specific restriction protein A